jgi:hypothetical protein
MCFKTALLSPKLTFREWRADFDECSQLGKVVFRTAL